jgi:hypothetical protein
MQQQTQPNQQTPAPSGNKPEVTIRHGAIGGSIFRQETSSGEAFYTFSISRSWKSDATGKSGYSTSFTERNIQELHKTIDECAEWIKAHTPAQLDTAAVAAQPVQEDSIPF